MSVAWLVRVSQLLALLTSVVPLTFTMRLTVHASRAVPTTTMPILQPRLALNATQVANSAMDLGTLPAPNVRLQQEECHTTK